jgi:hypothetical protein
VLKYFERIVEAVDSLPQGKFTEIDHERLGDFSTQGFEGGWTGAQGKTGGTEEQEELDLAQRVWDHYITRNSEPKDEATLESEEEIKTIIDAVLSQHDHELR